MTRQTSPPWSVGMSPYIVAEIGVNHNGSLEQAMALIDAAVAAGADAVKWQAFTAAELTASTAQLAPYQQRQCRSQSGSAPHGSCDQRSLLQPLELTVDDFARLADACCCHGVDFIVTPFSPRWVTLLEQFPVAAYKVGSGNVRYPALLQAIAETRRPVILSTGMSGLGEIDRALDTLHRSQPGPIAVLHCVSLYPTPPKKANLAAIRILARHTRCPIGFSDHTREQSTGALAVAAGATILEKHLTLDTTLSGPDHAMSLAPSAMAGYVEQARQAALMLGDPHKRPDPSESVVYRAAGFSIVSARPIPRGTVLTRELLTAKRPGTGLAPDQLDQLLGRVTACDIPADTILTAEMIGPSLSPPSEQRADDCSDPVDMEVVRQ